MDDTSNPLIPPLNTPAERMDFMKKAGVPEGFYLVSMQELAAIDQGTGKLHAEIRNWRVLSQAVFGVSDAEAALEVVKRQKTHRQGIADDRLRFREALMRIVSYRPKEDEGVASFVAAMKDIARKAINND